MQTAANQNDLIIKEIRIAKEEIGNVMVEVENARDEVDTVRVEVKMSKLRLKNSGIKSLQVIIIFFNLICK